MTTAHQLARKLLSGPDYMLVVANREAAGVVGASKVQTVETVGSVLPRGADVTVPAVVLTLEPEHFSYRPTQ